jgi:hypothetical protein
MLLKPNADHLTSDNWSRLAAKTHAGMAHFAGTGPSDKTCADCLFRAEVRGSRLIRCRKSKMLTGKTGKTFPPATQACKYFETDRKNGGGKP